MVSVPDPVGGGADGAGSVGAAAVSPPPQAQQAWGSGVGPRRNGAWAGRGVKEDEDADEDAADTTALDQDCRCPCTY